MKNGRIPTFEAKSTTQSVHTYHQSNSYLSKITWPTTKITRKNRGKMAEDVLKEHKTNLENNWVTYNCFPHIESISKLTVRFSEKHVFSRIAAKKDEKSPAIFRQNETKNKAVQFWYSVIFTDETTVEHTGDGRVQLSRSERKCEECVHWMTIPQ